MFEPRQLLRSKDMVSYSRETDSTSKKCYLKAILGNGDKHKLLQTRESYYDTAICLVKI